jgi:hypothetical protein
MSESIRSFTYADSDWERSAKWAKMREIAVFLGYRKE